MKHTDMAAIRVAIEKAIAALAKLAEHAELTASLRAVLPHVAPAASPDIGDGLILDSELIAMAEAAGKAKWSPEGVPFENTWCVSGRYHYPCADKYSISSQLRSHLARVLRLPVARLAARCSKGGNGIRMQIKKARRGNR